MALHQRRSGEFVTSFACKSGDHGEQCDEFLTELAAIAGATVMVCHCDCHPLCTRPACATRRAKTTSTTPQEDTHANA